MCERARVSPGLEIGPRSDRGGIAQGLWAQVRQPKSQQNTSPSRPRKKEKKERGIRVKSKSTGGRSMAIMLSQKSSIFGSRTGEKDLRL